MITTEFGRRLFSLRLAKFYPFSALYFSRFCLWKRIIPLIYFAPLRDIVSICTTGRDHVFGSAERTWCCTHGGNSRRESRMWMTFGFRCPISEKKTLRCHAGQLNVLSSMLCGCVVNPSGTGRRISNKARKVAPVTKWLLRGIYWQRRSKYSVTFSGNKNPNNNLGKG